MEKMKDAIQRPVDEVVSTVNATVDVLLSDHVGELADRLTFCMANISFTASERLQLFALLILCKQAKQGLAQLSIADVMRVYERC
jgi:hypothetical protein